MRERLHDSASRRKLTFNACWRADFADPDSNAIATHLQVKNPVIKMLPSLTLFMISIGLAWMNYGLLKK